MPNAARQPATEAPSFAWLLASLAAPRPEPRSWTDQLEDDVATLSYERALQRHKSPRAEPAAAAPGRDSAADSDPAGVRPFFQPEESGERRPPSPPAQPSSRSATGLDLAAVLPSEESRKRASVTVRLSRAEAARLQQRAAEANLTVSAYLRSCAFEVESLRAQVKQTLAELRAAQSAPTPRPHWWRRLFPRIPSAS